MATGAVRRRSEQAVIYLRAHPRGGFMARNAIGASGNVVTGLSRRRAAVVAALAISRRREQTMVYLGSSPARSFVATIARSLSSNVPRRLPGRRTSVVASRARARYDTRVIEPGAYK